MNGQIAAASCLEVVGVFAQTVVQATARLPDIGTPTRGRDLVHYFTTARDIVSCVLFYTTLADLLVLIHLLAKGAQFVGGRQYYMDTRSPCGLLDAVGHTVYIRDNHSLRLLKARPDAFPR